jgi:hypothetical protein
MSKVEDELRGDVEPDSEVDKTTPVDEHSDMADLASAAFANDLATIADTISCTDKGSK